MEKNKRKLNQEEVIRHIFPMLLNSRSLEKDFVTWAQDHWDELEDHTRNKLLEHSLGIFSRKELDDPVSRSEGSGDMWRVSLRLPTKWIEKMDIDRARQAGQVSRNQWMTEMMRKYFEQ